eukprot:TRINITY_DN82373_c0_g1_i1.p1 TRINITY_DN82373_c0_g1~~TRINITY_DN82373_c0_g1_i1.p1  ORF type:complete len:612 (+),score=212.27 TRINITY_DN82373_c0_g1_i1:158-1993(+)
MVCSTAEDLQARLALRALFAPYCEQDSSKGRAQANEDEDEASCFGPSAFHKRIAAEINEILEESSRRRLNGAEKKAAAGLTSAPSNGTSSPSAARAPPAAEAAPKRSVQTKDAEAQTLASSQVKTKKLDASIQKALTKAAESSRIAKPISFEFEPSKMWGRDRGGLLSAGLPTELVLKQMMFSIPQEKAFDPSEDVIRESITLKQTLGSVMQSIGSREKQIAQLKSQHATVEGLVKKSEQEEQASKACLAELEKDPSKCEEVLADRIKQRRKRVERLVGNVDNLQAQAKHFQKLAQQQRAFFVQSERIAVNGGQEGIDRHPAGEIFVVPAPENLGEDKAEAVAMRLAALGEQHPGVGQKYHNMAVTHHKSQEYEEAMRCYRKAFEILLAALGDVPPGIPPAQGILDTLELYFDASMEEVDCDGFKKALHDALRELPGLSKAALVMVETLKISLHGGNGSSAGVGVGEPLPIICAEVHGPLALIRRLRNMELRTMNVQGLPALANSDEMLSWDVGTAIANPYVCDSWPFEPNVLARRTPSEASFKYAGIPPEEPLKPCVEETQEDIDDEEDDKPRNPFRGRGLAVPPLPLGQQSSEEDESDDDRPSGTARSL